MLDLDPQQRKELGAKICDFVANYQPNQPDAVLFSDATGAFGYAAGPEVPAGCTVIMSRGELDWLMVRESVTAMHWVDARELAWFVDLVCREMQPR